MFDFRRIALFRLEKYLSEHKMTMFSKNLEGAWHLSPHLATPMSGRLAHSVRLTCQKHAYRISWKLHSHCRRWVLKRFCWEVV